MKFKLISTIFLILFILILNFFYLSLNVRNSFASVSDSKIPAALKHSNLPVRSSIPSHAKDKKGYVKIFKGVNSPMAIAINGNGDIFIAGDKGNGEIAEFDAGGNRIKTFRSGIYKPWDIAINKAGDILIANDGVYKNKKRIKSKGFITELNPFGKIIFKTSAAVNYPYAIAISKNGKIAVANYGNGFDGYISIYSGKGKLLHKFGHGIQNPYSIVFSKSGLIYAANFNEGSIVCLSPSGKVLWSTQKKISYPYAIALGTRGNLWVLNDGNGGSLSKYSPEGKLLKHINGPVSYPYGEAIDEKGNIFIANFNSNSVSEFSSLGKFLGYASKINRPIGIVIDKKGNVWAADGNGNLTKIENVAAGGEYFQFDKNEFPYGR
jgi:sugar lactone lactonase YvrE